MWGQFTWDGRWGHWGQDGVLSFSDHAYPVLVGVTVEIVPPGVGPVGAAHHLYTLLAALVVVGLPVTPVGVGQRSAITPRIAYMMGIVVSFFLFSFFFCVFSRLSASARVHSIKHTLYSPPSVGLCLRPIHLLLALLYRDRNSSSSWLWMLTRLAPLVRQSSCAAPQLFFRDHFTLWKSCSRSANKSVLENHWPNGPYRESWFWLNSLPYIPCNSFWSEAEPSSWQHSPVLEEESGPWWVGWCRAWVSRRWRRISLSTACHPRNHQSDPLS